MTTIGRTPAPSAADVVAATAAAAKAAPSAASITASAPKDQMGKDTFLKLLVAQMKYQNPMQPTDGAQYLAQTAQFSMVEKLDELAKQNAALITAGELSSATSLVGRTVTWAGQDGTTKTGAVSGARFTATGPVLQVGKDDVPVSSVQSVADTRPAGSTTAAGTTPTSGAAAPQ